MGYGQRELAYFVVSTNEKRWHLDASQRAMVAREKPERQREIVGRGKDTKGHRFGKAEKALAPV